MNGSLMPRWSFDHWNQWRRSRSGTTDITIVQLSVMCYAGSFIAVDVTLLGFGFALTRYAERAR